MLKKLVIAIPTYNRAEYINEWLRIHAEHTYNLEIDIIIIDNASEDNTKEIVNNWKILFGNISYFRNETNVGPIENALKPFAVKKYKYIWPMGDSYFVTKETLNNIDRILDHGPDLIILNLKRKKWHVSNYRVEEKVTELAGLISCYGVTVYKCKEEMYYDIYKYKESYFPHMIYISQRLINDGDDLYFSCDHSLEVIKLKTRRKNWASGKKVFEIGVESWVTAINQMPLQKKHKENAYKKLSSISGLFSFKSLIYLRAQGLLKIKEIAKYYNSLYKIMGGKISLAILVILIPVFILKPLVLIKERYDK